MAEIEARAEQITTTEATACGDAFVAAAERALASGDLDLVADAELERVLTAAVRLYAFESKPPFCDQAISPALVVL